MTEHAPSGYSLPVPVVKGDSVVIFWTRYVVDFVTTGTTSSLMTTGFTVDPPSPVPNSATSLRTWIFMGLGIFTSIIVVVTVIAWIYHRRTKKLEEPKEDVLLEDYEQSPET